LAAPVLLYAGATPPRTDMPSDPAAYFPTATGTKWVYRISIWRDDQREQGEEVKVLTEVNAGRHLVERYVAGGRRFDASEYALDVGGLRQRNPPKSDDDLPYDRSPGPWFLTLPAEVTPGASWVTEPAGDGHRNYFKAVRWETVHVPAGTFHALRVSYRHAWSDRSGRRHYSDAGTVRFAPQVGKVKVDVDLRGAMDFRGAVSKYVIELKSFSAPPTP
jgi:hypothetical protein